jgi:hypothetical protein
LLSYQIYLITLVTLRALADLYRQIGRACDQQVAARADLALNT